MLRGEDNLDDIEMFVILLDSNYTFIVCFPLKSVLYSFAEFFTYYTNTHTGNKARALEKEWQHTAGKNKKSIVYSLKKVTKLLHEFRQCFQCPRFHGAALDRLSGVKQKSRPMFEQKNWFWLTSAKWTKTSQIWKGFKLLTFFMKETQIAKRKMIHVYNTPSLLTVIT